MTAKRRHPAGDPPPGRRHASNRIQVRPVGEAGEFELVYPRCVRACKDDLEEVHKMLEAGEVDIAIDELRWLLSECRELLEAHKLLGEIALSDGDMELARAHLGYAYDLGRKALPPGGLPGKLPYARQPNQAFFEAGKGFAWCLDQSGEKKLAADVVKQLLVLDPSDPLDLVAMLPRDGEAAG
jgi:tetratricopeptide (TPR) repeat protein